jgi:hypothetical protein
MLHTPEAGVRSFPVVVGAQAVAMQPAESATSMSCGQERWTWQTGLRRWAGRSIWGDETGLSNQANHGRSFAPRGRTPVVSWPAERFTYSMISTLTNLGTSRSVIYDGALNAVLFLKSCVG